MTGSHAYNENTYRDDVVNQSRTVVQAIMGRTVIDSLESIVNLELVYNDRQFYVRGIT